MGNFEISRGENNSETNNSDSENTTSNDTNRELYKAEVLYDEAAKLVESTFPQEDEKRVAALVAQEEARLEAEAQEEKEKEFESKIRSLYDIEIKHRAEVLKEQLIPIASVNEYINKGLFRELKEKRAWRLSADKRGIDLTRNNEEVNKGVFGYIPDSYSKDYPGGLVLYCQGLYFEGEIDMDTIEKSFENAGEYLDNVIKNKSA